MSPTPQSAPAVVGVIGGGRMGAGIAQVFLGAGAHVAVVEAGGDAAEAARGRVAEGLAEGEPAPEAGEELELVRLSPQELEDVLGELEDAKTLVGILLYLRGRPADSVRG